VGFFVGSGVGAFVGLGVGCGVGFFVGSGVGAFVGFGVGPDCWQAPPEVHVPTPSNCFCEIFHLG